MLGKDGCGLQEKPPCSPPTLYQELKWDTQIDYFQKGPVDAVFPLLAEEVQPVTGASQTVLLCHRVCPVFFYNHSVWLSLQTRYQ